METRPCRHHYVPQFYLGGFTDRGTKDGHLFVTDLMQRRQWRTTPNGAGFQTDYHTIDNSPDGDPMAVERLLAKHESNWSQSLRSVIKSKSVANDENDEAFVQLMFFVAFMAVRVPRIRKRIGEFIDDTHNMLARQWLSTEEGRQAIRLQMEQAHGKPYSDEEFATFVKGVNDGGFTINYDRSWYSQEMIVYAVNLAPVIAKRRWSIWEVADGAFDLICSDSPVCCTWTKPAPQFLSPAFGTPHTIVTMPLSPRLLIVSLHEGDAGHQVLSEPEVANMNTFTATHAEQLFSREPMIRWMSHDEEVRTTEDLFNRLVRA